MPDRLDRIEIRNFRLLEDASLETKKLNILFGPNGAGKSTFLDAIWLIRDCVVRGIDSAFANTSHGIGDRREGEDGGLNTVITLETERARYEASLERSPGRNQPLVGETLFSKKRGQRLICRETGDAKAVFYKPAANRSRTIALREPEKLALGRYLDFEGSATESFELDRLLRFARLYRSRDVHLRELKNAGSEIGRQPLPWGSRRSLWSVLRNLKEKRGLDERYDTMMEFMKSGFPGFKDLLIEQTGPGGVHGAFIHSARRKPVRASGVSDGHLQMLICLTTLFSEKKKTGSLILFDDPEYSLHPHALAVLAKAVRHAAENWNRQIFMATHSPALISQFDASDLLASEIDIRGRPIIKRVSEIKEIRDLLEEYAVGFLYMAEMIAAQSKQSFMDPNP